MKYEKPVLIELPCAVDAIQSGISKTSMFTDNVDPNHPLNATTPAYEADE
jgi:hypothetical protein